MFERYDIGGRGWMLWGIFIIGMLVRLLHFWAISETAIPQHPLTAVDSDAYAFYRWAKTILAGDWLGRDTYHPYFKWMRDIAPLGTWYRWWGGKEIFHQAPLYPYLLAGLLALCKESVLLAVLAQFLVGSCQILILYRLATLFFGVQAGLFSAGITALYGPFVFYQGVFLRDWLPPILEPLALVALLNAKANRRPLSWILAGGGLALAVLTKETALLLVAAAFAWVMFYNDGTGWLNRYKPVGYLLAGLLLFLSPLFIRNAVVGAPVLSLSNRAAEAFALSNIPDRSSPYQFLPEILEHSQGHFLPGVMETVRTYQGKWPKLFHTALGKLILLKDSFELPNNVSFDYTMQFSPVLRWGIGYGFVFTLGLAGGLLLLKNWKRWALLYLYGFAIVGGLLVTNPISRYRLELVPVLILFSGGLEACFQAALSQKKGRSILVMVTVVLVCFLFQHYFLPVSEEKKTPYPLSYHASALAYAQEGRLDLAAAEMAHLIERLKVRPISEKVLTEASVLEGDYRSQWARQLLREGKAEEAMQQAKLAEAAYARNPSLSIPYFNLGVLYAYLGDVTKGKRFLEEFVNRDPRHPLAADARRLLARLDGAP